MQYKTIVLELLQQRPLACERLKKQRMMLEAVETFSSILKLNHEAIIQEMLEADSAANLVQVTQAAFEIAVNHLEEVLPSDSDQEGDDSLLSHQANARLH